MYPRERWPQREATCQTRGAGWYAHPYEGPRGHKGHKDSPAPLRAILWAIDTIWVQESPMAKIMEDGDPRFPHRCHTKHHGTYSTLKREDIKEQCPDRAPYKGSKSHNGRIFLSIIAYYSVSLPTYYIFRFGIDYLSELACHFLWDSV